MRRWRLLWIGAGLVGAGVALMALARIAGRAKVGNPSPPEPTKPVDLDRYLGRWFEIARYDQPFERGCAGVTADYSLRPDGDIEVVNRCRRQDGRTIEARGRAKVLDRATNAKLKVSFFGPFYGDYWVLDHADDYAWSIVGEGSGRYLWLLSRSPTLPEGPVSQLFIRARALGYDTSLLQRTLQP